MSRILLFIASLGIGFGFFAFLNRLPRFIPAVENAGEANADVPPPAAPSEEANADTKPE